MARYSEHKRDLIDETVGLWRERCLLSSGSLLFDDRAAWTPENLDDLYRRFNATPLEGDAAGGRFDSKWAQQMEGATTELRLLAAELVLVHLLFASSVTRAGKLRVVQLSLEDTDLELPEDAVPIRALDQAIGHPGIGFNTRRDLQVAYLIDFVRRTKGLSFPDLKVLLDDRWALRDFADHTDEPIREMRHIVLHLLCPDDFERMSSGTHKREIAAAFNELLDPGHTPEDVDEQLLAIRTKLEGYLPDGNTPTREIDFYHSPLQSVWDSTETGDSEGAGDLETLLWKKQIVFYGPPGTSKTWQAERLSETLIRRAALDAWKPQQFFSRQAEVDAAVKANVFWVQLHPGYGYDQFIRGLRLERDTTRFEPGLLPNIVNHYETQTVPAGLTRLPVVLVLDEINRTDLSALLGEAFSLLEGDKRGKPVELPGINPQEDSATLTLPAELYVIGTMNEIDQSVETLDFALRRRFLWRECPFERDVLLEIVRDRWAKDVKRFQYDDAAEQLDLLADRATALNKAIAEADELGGEYQVGHTYFADITFFLGAWLAGRKSRPPNGTFLWTARGWPQPPLTNLWSRSLKPLLSQYLSGSDDAIDVMRDLEKSFLGR